MYKIHQQEKMKRGDKLYCYNNITGNVNINVKMYITVGKYYNIYN